MLLPAKTGESDDAPKSSQFLYPAELSADQEHVVCGDHAV
jgi:hypothetical protein